MTSIQFLAQSMEAQWRRHEVLTNNIANASTPAFKKDDVVINPPASPTPGAVPALPTSGVSVMQWTDFTQGAVQTTGRPLDIAITGPGFIVVNTPAGDRYTRSGALGVTQDGTLVGPSGDPVMGRRGPIHVTSAQVGVTATGDVVEGERVVDTIKIVELPRPYALLKDGIGLYAPATPDMETSPATGFTITPGALEGSNVSSMESMVTMIEVMRTYEAAQKALQAVDEINQRATSDIGRTS